jgi:integrase
MSAAKDLYLKAKGDGRPKTFQQAADRAVAELVAMCRDKPIDTYSRIEANNLRDRLLERGLSKTSVRRTFSVLRAIVNFTTRELGLTDIRTFCSIYLGDGAELQEKKRKPIPLDVIRSVQRECHSLDDEARWLIALISDSGMRLSEAIGLIKSDLVLDGEYPYLTLQPHSWRSLKTASSVRIVPLVGEALWAAKRTAEANDGPFLFPKYCNEEQCKANSASAALNKWLSPRVPDGCVVHSFRHSMRDRLRATQCPADIIDRIGGWSVRGVGEIYGLGYPLMVLSQWMHSITTE